MEWRQTDETNVRARAANAAVLRSALPAHSDTADESESAAAAARERSTAEAEINHIKTNEAFLCAKPKHFLDENPIPPDYMLNGDNQQQQPLLSLPLSLAGHKRDLTAVDAISAAATGLKQEVDPTRAVATDDLLYFPQPSYTVYRMVKNELKATCSVTATSTTTMSKHLLPKSIEAWSENGEMRYHGSSGSRSGASSALGLNLPDEVESLGSKVECVYSLLSMLGSNDPLEMSSKFLELSRTPETCCALRRAGCIPLLVQMIHSENKENVAAQASMALQNVVHHHPDDKGGRRELKILRLLDQIISYCGFLKTLLQSGGEAIADDSDRHPLSAISSLMKVSFDEEHRHSMCELGALQVIPNLVHLDHAVHGPKPDDQCCNSLRRYALMALTNLTFGDENNKALLCSQRAFMEALVSQLDAAPDDLLQVTASVLRNLSWRADRNMKTILNEIGTVTALTRAAMKNTNENTLKAILSALWNLSAHCSMNKAEFCAVDGALAFLIGMLTYEGPSKTLKIIENAGGILRNVSSHIAVRENYRKILREYNCLSILLQQLKSESLTVVSNSCGTLWNLSARCPEDQKFLWDNGAVPMLRSLINSKHDMISEGSSSALKNLLNFRPSLQNQNQLDPIARSMGLKKLPSLNVRKQKALEQELEKTEHTETCENLDMELQRDKARTVAGASKEQLNGTEHNEGDNNDQDDFEGDDDDADHDDDDEEDEDGSDLPTGRRHRTRARLLQKSKSRDSLFSGKPDLSLDPLVRSSSASDDRRVRVGSKAAEPRTAIEEQPIDYAAKYKEDVANTDLDETLPSHETAAYQETDLDQLTDFSLRYAENHIDLDMALGAPHAANRKEPKLGQASNSKSIGSNNTNTEESGPVLLLLEDTVKCYQTEDTPYVISNATSVTDLTTASKNETVANTSQAPGVVAGSVATKFSFAKAEVAVAPRPMRRSAAGTKPPPVGNNTTHEPRAAYSVSGSHTPEKPINYCEEGTPGYFSRYESLSSLDEEAAPLAQIVDSPAATAEAPAEHSRPGQVMPVAFVDAQPSQSSSPLPPTLIQAALKSDISNSALETPLMFSRHSSMDSLIQPGEADGDLDTHNDTVGDGGNENDDEEDDDVDDIINRHYDDKSSVVSDFSRLASGIISPSEIPDSPTQSMPPSPRQKAGIVKPNTTRGILGGSPKQASVFEDQFSTFNVENTPAQFSCATSLSNLSFFDEEQQQQQVHGQKTSANAPVAVVNNISEGEEEEDDQLPEQSDDLLLASCIDIGMNRPLNGGAFATRSLADKSLDERFRDRVVLGESLSKPDETQPYYTENTPAVFSNLGSNSNLSAISIYSTLNEHTKDIVTGYEPDMGLQRATAGMTNASLVSRCAAAAANADEYDDVSSNASECGGGDSANQSIDLLQQCIRDGMKKATPRPNAALAGGNDTGFLRTLDFPSTDHAAQKHFRHRPAKEQKSLNDSLSSLSIDSDDDTNLLSQAIAAGCNRPKSNLGFITPSLLSKRSNSLSASQPIPIHEPLSSTASLRTHHQRQRQRHQHQQQQSQQERNIESFSSVDSSDSNDNQSKSLLELCILSGMHKKDRSSSSSGMAHNNKHQHYHTHNHRKALDHQPMGDFASSTQSNPNLMQLDSRHKNKQAQLQQQQQQSLLAQRRPVAAASASSSTTAKKSMSNDERLLQECINTGISKKVSSSRSSQQQQHLTDNHHNVQPLPPSRRPQQQHQQHDDNDNVHNLQNTVPKNLRASSAAARHTSVSELLHRTEAGVLLLSAPTAAPPSAVHLPPQTDGPNKSAATDVANSRTAIARNAGSGMSGIWARSEEEANGAANYQGPMAMAGMGSPLADDERAVAVGVQRKHSEMRESNQGMMCEMMVQAEGVAVQSPKPAQAEDVIGFNDDPTPCSMSESFIIMDPPSMIDETREAESIDEARNRKQKDPNLVMRSVERLTMEFMTSAEQMRMCHHGGTNYNNKANICNGSLDSHVPARSDNSQSSVADGPSTSTTTNTWNEDTCPNDVSFPSISMTPPAAVETLPSCSSLDMVDGLDGSLTPTTTTSSGGGIHFQLGGAVHSAALSGRSVVGGDGSSVGSRGGGGGLPPYSLLTTSIMIEREAQALANNLQELQFDEISFGYDLNNVAPPSGIESLNLCNSGRYDDLNYISYPESENEDHTAAADAAPPAGLSRDFEIKCGAVLLQPGYVARRALGHHGGRLAPVGSNESLNVSSNFLENIKPPSVMDDLLDSMISVDSIQSEIADCESMTTTISASNYRTAEADIGGVAGVAEFDDGTVTLCSCLDDDDENGGGDDDFTMHSDSNTPLQSDGGDYSSFECQPPLEVTSPQRSPLNAKQKRNLTKDRFKTYTIQSTDLLTTKPNAALTAVLNGNAPRSDGPATVPFGGEPQLELYAVAANVGVIHPVVSTTIVPKESPAKKSKIPAKPSMVALRSPQKINELKPKAATITNNIGPVKSQASRLVPKSSPTSSPIKQASSSQSPPAKSDKTNVIGQTKTTPVKTEVTSSSPPPPTELKREGTFVKETATVAPSNVPIVVDPVPTSQVSPPKKAVKNTISPRNTKVTLTQPRISSATAKVVTSRTPLPNASSPSKRAGTGSSSLMKNASTKIAQIIKPVITPKRSNTTITSNATRKTATTSPTSRVSTTTPPSRSNSNLGNNNTNLTAHNRNNSMSKIAPNRTATCSKPFSSLTTTTTNKSKIPASDVARSPAKTLFKPNTVGGSAAKIVVPVKPIAMVRGTINSSKTTPRALCIAPTSPSKIAVCKRK